MHIGLDGLGIEPGNSIGLSMTSKDDSGCMALQCLEVWGFPGISSDGQMVALLSPFPIFPMWMPAPGFASASGLDFHLIRVSDSKVTASVRLIDYDVQSNAYRSAQERRCLEETYRSTGPGDPRLCARDPNLVPGALADAKKTILGSIAKMAQALQPREFSPMRTLPIVTKDEPGPANGLVLTVSTEEQGKVGVTVLQRPSGEVLLRHTFKTTRDSNEVKGMLDPRRRILVLQLLGLTSPDTSDFQYAVLKLPRK
jgi:hypothetical protein